MCIRDSLGALLSLSWSPLGPSWSHLRPRMAIGSEKARKPDTLTSQYLKGFGPHRGLLGELFGYLEPSWSGLAASGSLVGAILRHLGIP
eukprot:8347384-Pyramimonas_sp.AAC.1